MTVRTSDLAQVTTVRRALTLGYRWPLVSNEELCYGFCFYVCLCVASGGGQDKQCYGTVGWSE